MKEQLYKRGYKKLEVEKQLKKVDSLERDDLLNQVRVKEQRQDRVPYVSRDVDRGARRNL